MSEYYAIDLPGKAIYDREFTVKIRKITPVEQKFISSLIQKEQSADKDFIAFIKQLVCFDSVDPAKPMTFERLYDFDLTYLLYRIRFTTYPKYPIKAVFKCDNHDKTDHACEHVFTKEVNMSELQIFTPDDLSGFSNTIVLENLKETTIRNKIIQDELDIDNYIKVHKLDASDTNTRLLLLDLCIIKGDRTLEEMYKLAETGEISAQDLVDIENWLVNSVWGVKEEVQELTCPKCNKEVISKGFSMPLEYFFRVV